MSNFRPLPGKLPKYMKAPVVEVLASLQFAELQQLSSVHLGKLWEAMGGKSRYPKHREMPPLAKRQAQGIPPCFEIQTKPEMCRQWFESEDESALIQFQRNRLVYNWRKKDQTQTYPHYHNVITNFFKSHQNLVSFLTENEWPTPKSSFQELAYVNIIPYS